MLVPFKTHPMKKKSVSEASMEQQYMAFFEEHYRRPNSVLEFVKYCGVAEGDFYAKHSSLEHLEESVWMNMADGLIHRLAEDETYMAYSVREKTLAFFFGFFEEALKHRSFVLYSAGDLKNPALLKFKRFKSTLSEYFEALAVAGIEAKELPGLGNLSRWYAKGALAQFLFLLNFWKNDSSSGFEATDEAIERSVNLIFDLAGMNALESGLGFARFLFRHNSPA